MTKTFYRTTFTIDVLSEELLGEMTLTDLDYEVNDGACVGGDLRMEEREITPKEAADACREFGAPGFFEIDDDGNPTEPEVVEPEDQSQGDILGLDNEKGDRA